jgi:glutamyl-Q tRNA(Asp) synthetase
VCTAKNGSGYDKGHTVPQAGGSYFTALSRSGHRGWPDSVTVTTRFAPSPTGALHLGHAHAAWFAHHRAREAGGRFLLRIEDIDAARCRAEYAAAIEEDLRWLGLSWDGPVRVQSAHLAAYETARASLAGRGLLYPCFCSRADVAREIAAAAAAPHGPDGAPLYPGTCRRLSQAERAEKIAAGLPHAWRLDMAAALAVAPGLTLHEAAEGRIPCAPERFGDVVLGRRDAPASYHLCATHDDAATGVTLVTRGADLKPAAHLHRLLQQLMGWPETGFAHHRLILDGQGRRLSKRDQSATLRSLREAGATPAGVLRLAGC